MNHIARLQADLAAARAEIAARTAIIQDFRTHLQGAKFSGCFRAAWRRFLTVEGGRSRNAAISLMSCPVR